MQVMVGRIGRPHGIRGEVSVEVRTDEPGMRFAAGSVLATEPADRGPLVVVSSRWQPGRLIVAFAGVTDRTAAEDLRGTWLALDSATLDSPADPDEFPDYELIGLTAVTTSGDPVGVVTEVRHHGQDLLVIQRPGASPGDRPAAGNAVGSSGGSGGARSVGPPGGGTGPQAREVLVPFVSAIVPEVDVQAGRLVIDPPPGLLDPAEAV